MLHLIIQGHAAPRPRLIRDHHLVIKLQLPEPLVLIPQIIREHDLLLAHLPQHLMKHHLKSRRIIMVRKIFKQGDLTDIGQVFLLVTFIRNNIEYTGFKIPSVNHVLSGYICKIRLFQTEIDIIRQVIVLKYLLFLK